jgi:hypothetical protein
VILMFIFLGNVAFLVTRGKERKAA